MSERKPRIGFIGAGRVARTLAPALAAAGYQVSAVASRSFRSADALAAGIANCTAYESLQAVVEDCDLVLLTLPDDAIQPVAGSLRWRQGVAVVHTSGAHDRASLTAAAAQGAETGSLHPLQTFAGPPVSLEGCYFGVEADGRLREVLLGVVASLGGSAVALDAHDKALYHVSAVLASNYVVTLLHLAAGLWQRLGVERQEALQALLPLLRGTVGNLERLGLPAALTGPIARGDEETLRRHLAALSAASPALLPVYRSLGGETVSVALAAGGIDQEVASLLHRLLREGTASEDTPAEEAVAGRDEGWMDSSRAAREGGRNVQPAATRLGKPSGED